MKWAGFLLSWLGSLPSWLQVAYRWCGQPVTVLRGALVLATCCGLVIGYLMGDQGMLVMPKSPQGPITWPGTGGSAESVQAAEADSARAKAEAFISVISNHVANADSAEQFRQQITAAVDRIPADQLQHVIDSVFARPLTGLPEVVGAPGSRAPTDPPDRNAGPAGHR